MSEWKDWQKMALITYALDMTKVTEHNLKECIEELGKLIGAYRRNNDKARDGSAKT